jgi:putative FmdB family regulatory protein
MPTYEYACKRCGHRVEVVQSMSEEPLTVCGVCGGELRKVFHPAGVLFKGSGFYSTDSRGSPKTASSESKPDGATGDRSSGTGDRSRDDGSSGSGSTESSSPEPSQRSKERPKDASGGRPRPEKRDGE